MFSGTGNRGAHERHPLFSSPQAAPPARFPRKHAGRAGRYLPFSPADDSARTPSSKKTRPSSEKICTARPIMIFSFLDPGRRLPLKNAGRAGKPARPAELYLDFCFYSARWLSPPGKVAIPFRKADSLPFKAIISLPARQAENFRQKPLTVDKIFLLYRKTGVRPPKKRPFRLLHRGRKGACAYQTVKSLFLFPDIPGITESTFPGQYVFQPPVLREMPTEQFTGDFCRGSLQKKPAYITCWKSPQKRLAENPAQRPPSRYLPRFCSTASARRTPSR